MRWMPSIRTSRSPPRAGPAGPAPRRCGVR
jgi:hypothetical protein